MRARDLAVEAWRNVRLSGIRTLGLILAIAFIFGSSVASELAVSSQILRDHREFVDAGGYVAVGVGLTPAGIPAQVCGGLRSREAVLAAGFVADLERRSVRSEPGRSFRTVGIGVGTLDVFDPDRPPEVGGEVAVGGALVEELGIASGGYMSFAESGDTSMLRRVSAVYDSSVRAPRYGTVVAAVMPSLVSANECWVEFSPQMYSAGATALRVDLMVDDKAAIVSRVVDPGYDLVQAQDDLATRAERFAWAVGGLVVGALLWLVSWMRRADYALLRAIGWGSLPTAVLIQLEHLYLVVIGGTIGWLWATVLGEATTVASLTTDQLFIAGKSAVSLGLLAMSIGALVTITTGGGKAILSLLKHE
ncbi:hypothetical protein MNBD_ACTINO02-1914 [hydrothermal vent metagenome]|uniref:ABC3 transporter permease protein domain-containing protein n=1 Tax=hydrothermal vent metagenome TaxID=652676 RepID=A0A3B0SKR1_9ZZZZ